MDTAALREELTDFYWNRIDDMAAEFRDRVFPLLDERWQPDMTACRRKAMQYETIAECCAPVLFHQSPFYHELGAMQHFCDGAGDFRGVLHAGGWNYARFSHLFADQNPELFRVRCKQGENLLYLICGPYADTRQHFYYNCNPIFSGGLKSLYDAACAQLETPRPESERDFLRAAVRGLLSMKAISEKFARAAEERLKTATDEDERQRLARIADSAAHTPWNAPRTFYEALNTLAFMRTVPGTLEGVGYNSFGRPDLALLPFYERDLAAGRLTKDEAYALIKAFLLIWDCHYDHDMKMTGYGDHELENTYVLGGCDRYGRPVWNDLTEMFLRATREEKIIFPKIKVRYGASSPKAYLDAADQDVIAGTSSVLYENDDAMIPALVRAGFSLEDARDYLVTGCWSPSGNGNEKSDHGNYINLLKAFEFSVHNRRDKMAECRLNFRPLDGARSFEEVYQITMANMRALLRERNRMTHAGKGVWRDVDPLPLTSASLEGCLQSGRDLTEGGCKYHNEQYLCVGLPNIIDSLLAIKTLCFERKTLALDALLKAVRCNWEGYEDVRQAALKCPCWGDGGAESGALAARFNADLYKEMRALRTFWPGGVVTLGHLTYTEIRFWGEKTLATPDGRRNGDYFSQGLTPSRLHRIDSVTDVAASLRALDGMMMAGNTVVNIILPSTRMTLDLCEAFLRAMAGTALGSLQLNCTTREQLLDAQAHPENYPNLIVRVCGFSARFTSLSLEWQQEVLSRNFYD